MQDNYQLPKEGGLIPGAEPEDIICRYEKIRTRVVKTETEGAEYVADVISEGIKSKNAEGKPYVMVLSAGKSPMGIYRRLVEKYLAGEVSFGNVVVFSLDELYPISAQHQLSQNYKLRDRFLNHVDIRPENVFMIDASIPIEAVHDYCRAYEAKIEGLGGADIALLGFISMNSCATDAGFTEYSCYFIRSMFCPGKYQSRLSLIFFK